jgi:hypothetical protein
MVAMHAEAWRYVRRIQDNAMQFVMQCKPVPIISAILFCVRS